MFRWAPEGISACAFVLPYGRSRNYGMFSTFQTPLVVLLIDLLARGGWRVAEARLIDTLIGPAYACHRHVTGDQSLDLVAGRCRAQRAQCAGGRTFTYASGGSGPAMTQFGYTALCEQTPVKQLVADLVAAEQGGFDFSVMSDHYFPWLEDQGHSGYAWSVLGAAAQATQRLPLMTFVTCPTFRYHPAVVAQKAATVGVLSDGRFTLGLGAGENLNEHVVGGGWPAPGIRHERLSEAVDIIRALFGGGYVNYRGSHFDVERAKLYDLPEPPPPIAMAVSGPDSVRIAGEKADSMISVQPEAGLVRGFSQAGGDAKPKYGQLPICFDRDEAAARARAREQWRWGVGGWPVMAELPDPDSFDAYSRHIREDDICQVVSCGPDVGQHVKAVKQYVDAGFTHVTLVQVGGGSQAEFISWARDELLPALRSL